MSVGPVKHSSHQGHDSRTSAQMTGWGLLFSFIADLKAKRVRASPKCRWGPRPGSLFSILAGAVSRSPRGFRVDIARRCSAFALPPPVCSCADWEPKLWGTPMWRRRSRRWSKIRRSWRRGARPELPCIAFLPKSGIHFPLTKLANRPDANFRSSSAWLS